MEGRFFLELHIKRNDPTITDIRAGTVKNRAGTRPAPMTPGHVVGIFKSISTLYNEIGIQPVS